MATDRPTLGVTPAVYQILLSLTDAERHGYGIMQEVAERTRDEVRLGPGTLYRSIKLMRKAGLIESTESDEPEDGDGDRRRFYRITGTGRHALGTEAQRLARLVAQARTKRVLDEPA
jgi:DNA-binding PadR family transcriptional regulator